MSRFGFFDWFGSRTLARRNRQARRRSRVQAGSAKRARLRQRQVIEALEDRTLLSFSTPVLSGNNIVFNGDAGAANSITFSVDGSGRLQHNLGGTNGFNSNIDLDNQTAGNQTRLVSNIKSLTYTDQDSSKDDTVAFDTSEFNFSNALFTTLTVNAGIVNFTNSADVAATGTGTISLTAAKNISLASGTSLTTVDGNLTLSANQQATASSGNFIGINVNAATVQSTGTGTVTVQGRGGNDTGGAQIGVEVQAGGKISGGTSGTLTVTGTGGAVSGSTGNNRGVLVTDANSTMTSLGANVSVTGSSNATDSGGNDNGIAINNGAIVTAGGAGSVTLVGSGGASTGTFNRGVFIGFTGSGTVTSSGGNISVTGTGGGTGASTGNLAVTVGTSGTISTATNGGTITIVGDSLNINSGGTIDASSTGLVTVRPKTNGTAIDLGGDDASGTVGLTNAELGRITAGTLNIGDANSGAITVSAAITRSAATNLVLTSGNNIAFSGSSSLDSFGGNVTLSTSGTGAISSGTATTDINAGAGTVLLTAGSAGIGTTSNRLAFSGTNLDTTTSGNGNQFLSASGSITIDSSGLSAGTGTIELDGGTFTITSDSAFGSSPVTLSGATLQSSGSGQTLMNAITAAASTTSTIDTPTNANLTLNGNISGSGTLNKSGAYSVFFGGNNSGFSGTFNLNESNVFFSTSTSGSANAAWVIGALGNGVAGFTDSSITVKLGSLSMTNSGTGNVGNLGGGSITFEIGALNTDTTFNGQFQDFDGTASLNKVGTGTLTLTQDNTYSGTTTISGGTLQVGNGGTTGTLGSGLVIDNATLIVHRSDSITLTNAVSGTGTLILMSTGGAVAQSTGITVSTVAVTAATGITLTDTGNAISTLSAINRTSGDIAVIDAANLTIHGIAQSGNGNVSVSSTGTNTSLTVDCGITSLGGGSVKLQATGDLNVAANQLVNSGSGALTLAADVTSSGAGNDGSGMLTINAGAGVYGANITLRGADLTIDSSAAVGRAAAVNLVSTFVQGLNQPIGMGIDSGNNLYALNTANHEILKVTPCGAASTFSSGFTQPYHMARDSSGNFFVADPGANAIDKVSPTGAVSFFASGQGLPFGVAVDSSGSVYVAEFNLGRVSKYNSSGALLNAALVSGLANPNGLAIGSDGNLYVAENGAGRVGKYDTSGNVLNANFATGLQGPNGLTFDAAGNLYVSDQVANSVIKVTPSGAATTYANTGLNTPTGLVFDSAGNLFVNNYGSNAVTKIAPVAATTQLTIRSSVESRPMSLGGTTSAVAGINLTDAELGRIVTASTGTMTIGSSSQTGNITFTTATPTTTAGAATTVVESSSGAGQVILDNGAGAGTALNGNSGAVTITAGTGGIVEADSNTAGTADLAGSLVTLTSGGAIGAAGKPIQFAATTLSADTSANSGDQFLRSTGTVSINSLNAGTGTIDLLGGTFNVTSTGTVASPITVGSGATLGGTGTTTAVTVQSGGTLAPGANVGRLNTGNVTFASGSTFAVELNGPNANQYDQLKVTGTVTLGGSLNVSRSFTPAVGKSFTVIDNDGTDAVTEIFSGVNGGTTVLADGSTFIVSGITYQITYAGGTDHNDVVLTVTDNGTRPSDGTADSSKTKKIGHETNGGPTLNNRDLFGSAVAQIGDLDGDGVTDMAVGADGDRVSGINFGAVYVLFMNSDGTAKSSTKIARNTNGGPNLKADGLFGLSVTAIGDLDGDGVTDLAVGARGDTVYDAYYGYDYPRGAVYVLLMNSNGSAKSSTKIANATNGGPELSNFDGFGQSVASLGDLNGDGVTDLAVGAYGDNTGGSDRGAVYVLFMNSNGTAASSTKIASGTNNGPVLKNGDLFGTSVASLGDLDGDGVTDLAVGAIHDSTGPAAVPAGAVHLLRLNTNGSVKSSTKITSFINGGPPLGSSDFFGSAVTSVGDLNGDGVTDLAIGAAGTNVNDAGDIDRGATYLLFLNAVATVTTPTVAYVDDDFVGLSDHQSIADADSGTDGAQSAVFGVNAFTTIGAALNAITSSGQVIVNAGTYGEAVSVSDTRTLTITTNAAVTVNSLATVAGTTVQISGTSLTVGDGNNTTIAGVVNGVGGLTKIGSGTLTVTAANTYSGNTTISAGTLTVANNAALGTSTVRLSGGTLQSSGTGQLLTNNVVAVSASTLDTPLNANLTLNGNVSGAGTINKTGAYSVILGGNNSGFEGTFNLNESNVLFSTSNSGSAKAAWVIGGSGHGVSGFVGTGSSITLQLGSLSMTNSGTGNVGNLGGGSVTFEIGALNTNTTFNGLFQDFDGVAALTKVGSGTLTLTGTNTYSGTTTISDGTLQIGAGGSTGKLGTGAVTDNAALVFNRSDTLTVGNAIIGNGTLTQSGSGTLILTGGDTYSGVTTVNGGTLLVNGTGSLAAASAVTVANGATLGGDGTIGGTVLVQSGGRVAPGAAAGSTGILNTGSITFQTGASLVVEINSATPGTGYDQLNVTGTVTVEAGQNAIATGTIASSPGQQIVLVKNDGTDAISGTATAGEGGAGAINGVPFVLSYFGGAGGNDFTLTERGPMVCNGTNGDDTFEVRRVKFDNVDSIVCFMNGVIVDARPFASVASVLVNGLGGNDTLTVNDADSGGFFPMPVSFDGGVGTGDKLLVKGGSFGVVLDTLGSSDGGSITYDVDGNGTTTADQGRVIYTGIEQPVDITGSTITNLLFLMPSGGSAVTLGDDGTSGNGVSRLSSSSATPTFTTTDFRNPTGELGVLGGNGSDTLTVNALPDFNASLGIGQFSTITFAGAITLAAGKTLSADATGTISLSGSDSDIATSGTGRVNLVTDRDITLASGSSLTTVDGGITLRANDSVPTLGNFIGIDANNATIQTTGKGNVFLHGRGGDEASSSDQHGVSLHDGTSVSSTFNAADAGTITIIGTGGNGTRFDLGVFLSGTSTDVTSVNGAIEITGTGMGSGNANIGVSLGAGKIESQGTGPNAATITITGIGGNGTGNNRGVSIQGTVTSVDGAIAINGIGGAESGSSNIGAFLAAGSKVESTGTGPNAATITIIGTGGNGDDSDGVRLINGAQVRVTSGSLSVTGTVTGGDSAGVSVDADGKLASLGSGRIVVTATGHGMVNDLVIGALSSSGSIGGASATGNITLNADSIDFSGTTNIQSTGNLTIRPRTASRDIVLGVNSPNTLSLDATELSFLHDGFSSITIGDAINGTGEVAALFTTFTDPVTIVGGKIGANFLDAGTNDITLTARTGNIRNAGQIGSTLLENLNIRGGTVTLNAPNGSIGNSTGSIFDRQFILAANKLKTNTAAGNGNQVLAAANSAFGLDPINWSTSSAGTGTITLAAGTFLVRNGHIITAGTVSVATETTLGGDVSQVTGTVTVQSGGSLSPGTSSFPTAFMQTGNLTLADNSTFAVDLNGTFEAAVEFDQIQTFGTVTLGGMLNVSVGNNFMPAVDDQFRIISNDGTDDAVVGTFSGVNGEAGTLTEGADFVVGTTTFQISYAGGDGNDVVLTVVPARSLTATLDANGNLTITDADPTGKNNNLTVSVRDDGVNQFLVISDAAERFQSAPAGATLSDGNKTLNIPLTGVTGTLQINAAGGNDTITVRALRDFLGSLRIRGGTGDDTANFTGDITFAPNKSLSYSTGVDVAPGSDTVTVGANVDLATSGTGAIAIRATRNVTVSAGSSLTTQDGVVIIDAGGLSTPTAGNFTGILLLDGASITTMGVGPIFLTGHGGNDPTTNGHHGIALLNGARIQSLSTSVEEYSNAGAIELDGTGGTGNGSNVGVFLSGAGTAVTSAAGELRVDATAGSGRPADSPALNLFAGASITSTSKITGNNFIDIAADSMNIDPAATISAGTQEIFLRPQTNGQRIDLGGADAPGKLGLTNAELNRITAGTLLIGSDSAGSINVSAAITRAGRLNLVTGDSVTQSTSNAGLSVTRLAVTAPAGIGSSSQALTISDLKGLTTDSSGMSGKQFLRSVNTVSITSLNAGTGTIELDGGTFNLSASDRINDNSAIQVDAGVFNIGSFSETVDTVTLSGGGITGTTGVLTSTNTIQTQSGSVSAILAGVNGLRQSTSGTTTLTGSNRYTGTTTISGGTLQIGDGGAIGTLGGGPVTDNAALVFNRSDSITVASAISGTGTLTLTSTDGSISQSAAIIVPTVTANAARGITLTDPGNTFTTFSAINRISNDISAVSAAALNVSGIRQSGSGNVNVATTGANTSLTLNGDVTSSGGSVTLQATGNLTVAANQSINSDSGTLSLGADLTAAGAGDDGNGTLTISAGTTIHGESIALRGGDVQIDSTGRVGGIDGPSSTFVSNLNTPTFAAFDDFGTLYVANYGDDSITKVTPDGVMSPFVSSGLNGPVGLAIDRSGNLYVANLIDNTISKVTSAGEVSTFVSSGSGLNVPLGMAVDSGGNLYVADYGDNTIREFTPTGETNTFVSSGLNGPVGLAFDHFGNLYVTTYDDNTITKVTRDGEANPFVSSGLNGPAGMAFDSSGNLYVANLNDSTISRVTPDGDVSTIVHPPLNGPLGLAIDSGGKLYVANLGDNTISRFALVATRAVTIRSSLASSPVNLGGNGTAVLSAVNLTDGELDRIASSTLVIGNANNGTITISDDITQPGKNLTLVTGTGLAGSGGISIGSATATVLTVNQAGASSYSGVLGGATDNDRNFALVKLGGGTLTLDSSNAYTGTTTISGGTLLIEGSIADGPADTDVTVTSGATLGGTGTIEGAVKVQDGGTLSPGTGAGCLATGGLTLASGSTFAVQLNGSTACTQYDRVTVTGQVTLGGSLNVILGNGFAPQVGSSFMIIDNDGDGTADTVRGTFSGVNDSVGTLVEGATFLVDLTTFRVSYAGGDGNDVVLTVVPTGSLTATLSDGDLTITDADPVGKNNHLSINVSADGLNLIVTDATERFQSAPAGGTLSDSHRTLTIPLSSVSRTLGIIGRGGDDTITVGALPGFLAELNIQDGTGTDSVNFDGDVTFNSGKTLGVVANSIVVAAGADLATSGTGDIELVGDNISIEATASLVSTDKVTLRALTRGRAIDLGGLDTGTALGLTDAELDRITAGTLQIGDLSSGPITVSADITQLGRNLTLATGAGVTGSGGISIGSATATTLVINQPGTSTYSGVLGGTSTAGNFALIKDGDGTLTLSGTNTYSGATTINAGTLLVNGSLAVGSAVTVNSGGTLGGSGAIGGTVAVNAGGTVAPGAMPGSTGILNTGSITFATGSNFVVDVNSATPGSGHDQINVTGTVMAELGTTLVPSGTIESSAGQQIVLIKNDGSDSITGTATGSEGLAFRINNLPFIASFVGGVGVNDYALIQPGPMVCDGTNGDDTMLVIRSRLSSGDAIVYLRGGTVVGLRPTASVTDITVNGLNGNDRLIIVNGPLNATLPGPLSVVEKSIIQALLPDFVTVPVTFHGGTNPTTGQGDGLVVLGGSFGHVEHTFTDVGPGNSGGIVYDSDGDVATRTDQATISYDGIEQPVDMSGNKIDDLVFNPISTAFGTTLGDDGAAGNNVMQIQQLRSLKPTVSIQTVKFATPTNRLTVNTGGVGNGYLAVATLVEKLLSNGAFTVAELDSKYNAGLTINGGSGNNFVVLNASLAFASNKSLDVNLQNSVTPGTDAIFVGSNVKLVTSGAGTATLKASGTISLGQGSSIETVNGGITIEVNQQTTTIKGNVNGFDANGATIKTSGTGNILLKGRGTDDATTTQHGGVVLHDGVSVSSISSAANAGSISMIGAGGTSSKDSVGVTISGSSISSLAGSISITGTGGNGQSAGNYGVAIGNGAAVQVTAAALTVTGTAITGNSNGVWLGDTSSRLASRGSGSIDVTAKGVGTAADLAVFGTSIVGGTTAKGDITLVADSIELRNLPSVQSQGSLIVRPRTANTTIGLGTGATGTLNLDATELGFLHDGFRSITIGDATNGTGAVDVNASNFTDPVTIVGGSISVTQLNAVLNPVTLTARTGNVSDGGDAGTDLTGGLVTLNAPNGTIGASGDAISLVGTIIPDTVTTAQPVPRTFVTDTSISNGNQFLEVTKTPTGKGELTVGSAGLNAGTGTITLSAKTGVDADVDIAGTITCSRLIGGQSSDVFRFLPGGRVTGMIDSAGGLDVLNYRLLTDPITVNLTTGTASLTGGVVNIEHVFGGAGNDLLIGDSATNQLVGNGGDDTLVGNGGDDALTGGNGNDVLNGGDGDDVVLGGMGDDIYVFADAATSQTDTVSEKGGNGRDTLDFSGLTTSVTVNLTSDTALATHTNRTVKTGATGQVADFENVLGGAGNDKITGNAAANVLVGNGGNDELSGGAGRDLLIGGAGADVLRGGADDDLLIGGTTSHDSGITALEAVMAEWIRTDQNYSQRIAHLLGTTTGGKNGSVLLKRGTVQNDADAIDNLFGEAALDWFFQSPNDAIKDRNLGGNETTTTI